jgi:hypothetical protein
MNKALADFAQNPLSYDLHEMMDDEEIQEMAHHVEALRKELYEAAGRNRNYHVKAEDVKHLLPDWEGADGCIATNRITVEGRKVGYCYRESRMATGTVAGASPPVTRARRTWTTPTMPGSTS